MRWRKEYIALLQLRVKWQSPKPSLSCNDLVLVADYQLPRNQWPLGRVSEVLRDKRGYVRSAVVKMAKFKNSNLTDFGSIYIHRPITKLVLLHKESEH